MVPMRARIAERLHQSAERDGRWEHVMSEAVERHLFALLRQPAEPPWGSPIPAGTRAIVRRIGEPVRTDARLMSALRYAGVRPGANRRVRLRDQSLTRTRAAIVATTTGAAPDHDGGRGRPLAGRDGGRAWSTRDPCASTCTSFRSGAAIRPGPARPTNRADCRMRHSPVVRTAPELGGCSPPHRARPVADRGS